MIAQHLATIGPAWFYHPLGYCPRGPTYLGCRGYNWWSGIASDFGELTLVIGMFAFYWKHTCHVSRCWRWAKHPIDGTPYVACKKHHPGLPNTKVTAKHLEDAHAAAVDLREARLRDKA